MYKLVCITSCFKLVDLNFRLRFILKSLNGFTTSSVLKILHGIPLQIKRFMSLKTNFACSEQKHKFMNIIL